MFKLLLCFFFIFPFASYAQEKKQEIDELSFISPFIANYPLTEDLLLKLEKIKIECKNLYSKPEQTNKKSDLNTYNDNIEKYAAYISNNPKLVNILKENNITPKDFVVAHLALQATLYVLTNEENSTYEKNFLPSNNIEFAKEHMYRIIKILKDNC
ncbi:MULTISPECIES: hypothetical protein [unclassified Bartonella]|uniref:hypothetical protein n=1 Tax=unclassified Bartonella TaxID=2645622 RepID=UPI0035D04948